MCYVLYMLIDLFFNILLAHTKIFAKREGYSGNLDVAKVLQLLTTTAHVERAEVSNEAKSCTSTPWSW